jgi:hypothetical protein
MIESSHTNSFSLIRAPGGVVEDPRRGLPDLLLDLVHRLTAPSGRKPVESPLGTVHRYQDDDFDYVEVALRGIDDVDADICIHGGRIFARIVR